MNIRRGALEGQPEMVVDGVYSAYELGKAAFSVSRNGVLAWTAGRAGLAQLTWFDRKGNAAGTGGPSCTGEIARLSPDERHVLLNTVAEHDGFAIVEQKGSGQVALPGIRKPLWMADGLHILYARKDGNIYRVVRRAIEGGAEQELARLPALSGLMDVSRDAKALLYKQGQKLYSAWLSSTSMDGSPGIAQPQWVADSVQGRFSPDGRSVVYSAVTTGGRLDVFAQPFPLNGLRTQLTSEGGRDAVWRGDGKEIVYRKDKTLYLAAGGR